MCSRVHVLKTNIMKMYTIIYNNMYSREVIHTALMYTTLLVHDVIIV